MTTEMVTILKDRGITLAAENRSKTLRLCREYLYELAHRQETVTADDAQRYVENANLSPLGNAAGSLFRERHWEFTGWEPSKRTSNHTHLNRVWRLRDAS